MKDEIHVIFGTGPVGCWTAFALRSMGLQVRAVNRSGNRPDLMPEDVDIVAADVSDASQAVEAAKDASVVYQALNPLYHKWHDLFPGLQSGALLAAKEAGARYVSIENLYMYDSSETMTEDTRIQPKSKKGELRAHMAEEVMEAHKSGKIQATAVRASDYYGPGVEGSALGEMVFGNLVAGKKAQITGSDKMPHSWAYIEDVGMAAAIVGTRQEALGNVWIAPHAAPVTQGEIIRLAEAELGRELGYRVMGRFMMRVGGLFIPAAREMVEMMYEFEEPFVVSSARIQQTFGLQPTPVEQGIQRTVRWYQKKLAQR